MTKKDYELLAKALREASHLAGFNGNDAVKAVGTAVTTVAAALAKDNPKFDRQKFFNAVREGR